MNDTKSRSRALPALIAGSMLAMGCDIMGEEGSRGDGIYGGSDTPTDTVTPTAGEVGAEGLVVQAGYRIRREVAGLDFPTAVTFVENRLLIGEAGFLEGLLPKIKEVGSDGSVRTILSSSDLDPGVMEGPLTDVTYNRGWIYLAHRQVGANGWMVGAISRFKDEEPIDTFETLITNLPSAGDHYTEDIVFDREGRMYFAQGTATNSAVVGQDSEVVNGWLGAAPTFHDYPPVDVALAAHGYESENPLTVDPDDTAVTAAYRPFGSGRVTEGTVVKAATPENPRDGMIIGVGSIYSIDTLAADPRATLRLEAWGLRNPFGMGLDPLCDGKLFSTNNGADHRTTQVIVEEVDPLVISESRPVGNDWDDLFEINIGGDVEFFGWPDYFHDPQTGSVLPITDDGICQLVHPLNPGTTLPNPTLECDFVLSEAYRSTLKTESATAEFALHSSANKFDFATSRNFGYVGDLFVAETGSLPPSTGAPTVIGHKIVRVDRRSGQVFEFIRHESLDAEGVFSPSTMNKPIDVKFMRSVMYVVDFGIFEPGIDLQVPGSGKVWIVDRCDEAGLAPTTPDAEPETPPSGGGGY